MLARALGSIFVLAAVASTAFAQPKPTKDKIKATLLCGVVKDGKVATVVPTKDKRKLADPISCAIPLDQDSKKGETWNVHLFVEDGEPDGHPGHDGEISRTGKDAHDFEAVLVPGTDGNRQDYWSCQMFAIRAMISNDT